MKVLMMVDSDPEVREIASAMERVAETVEARMEFIRKQVDKYKKDADAEIMILWDEMEKRLKSIGKLGPEYDREEFFLNLEGDAIVMRKPSQDIRGFLSQIFGGYQK